MHHQSYNEEIWTLQLSSVLFNNFKNPHNNSLFFRILWEFNGSKIHIFIPGKHIRLNIPYSYYGKYLTTDKRIQVTALCEVMRMHGVKLLVEKTIILEDTNIIIKVNYYLPDVLNRQKELESHSGAQILIWELGDKGIHLSCNFRCCSKILPAWSEKASMRETSFEYSPESAPCSSEQLCYLLSFPVTGHCFMFTELAVISSVF